MKTFSRSLLFVLCVSCFCAAGATVEAGGVRIKTGLSWKNVGGSPFKGNLLQKNTGLTTPKPIQRIAPYGVSMKNLPQVYSYQYSSPGNQPSTSRNSQYQWQQQQQRYQDQQRQQAAERQRQIQQQRWQQQQRQMQQQQFMREHQNIMRQGQQFQQQMMQNAINSLNRYTNQNQYNRGW